jgi:hypothetical protein
MPLSATIEQITRVSINSQSQIDDLGAPSGAGAEASGSSTLSLSGKNMKVEKGAVFLLRTDKSLNLATGQTPKQ